MPGPPRKYDAVAELPDSTRAFSQKDLQVLNVHYISASSADDIVRRRIDHFSAPKDLYVDDLSASEIQSLYKNLRSAEFEKLANGVKTQVGYIGSVLQGDPFVRGTPDSDTYTFVFVLLFALNHSLYPLLIRRDLHCDFSVKSKVISSELDFFCMEQERAVLFDTDKHLRSDGPVTAWGEYQLVGEMIATAACSNVWEASENCNKVFYLVRVFGLKFTFYKAVITPEYLAALKEGTPPMSLDIVYNKIILRKISARQPKPGVSIFRLRKQHRKESDHRHDSTNCGSRQGEGLVHARLEIMRHVYKQAQYELM